MTLRVDWCSHAAADYAVKHWHYSRSLPTPPLVKVGVWEDSRFIGCVLFSRGANKSLGTPYGLATHEVAELTRIALSGHGAPVSKIISLAIKFLRTRSPGLRLLVSYADPVEGHHGGIYQASNWLYLGQTDPSKKFLGPDGKLWHPRMISPSGVKPAYGQKRAVWRPDQCKEIPVPGKHRYVLPLDPSLRESLKAKSLPYPKRASVASSDALAVQAREGGAAPTPTLHNG